MDSMQGLNLSAVVAASGGPGEEKKKTLLVTDEVWKQAVANVKMRQLLLSEGVLQADTEDILEGLTDEEFMLIEQEIEMMTGTASVGK